MAKDKKSDGEKSKKDGKEKKGKKKAKGAKQASARVEKKPVVLAPKALKKIVKSKPAAKPKSASAPATAISNDDISQRAYFIAERRQAMGWEGDSNSDWVEAERQLKAEASRKK